MSIGSISGLTVLAISFCGFYALSYKVLYFAIPSLFEFGILNPIDFKSLGIDQKIDHAQLVAAPVAMPAPPARWVPKIKGTSVQQQSNSQFQKLVHHLFAFNFSTAMLVMELSLCEIEDFLSKDGRLVLWHALIPIVSVFLVFVTPVSIAIIMIERYLPIFVISHKRVNYVVMAIIIVAWLYLLSELDVISGINTDGLQHSMVSKYVSELTLLGITMIAALGGVGTISNPFYEFFKRSKPVTKLDIDKIIRNLNTTDQILKMRQEDLNKLGNSSSNNTNSEEVRYLEEEVNTIIQLKSSLNHDLIVKSHRLQLQKHSSELKFKLAKFIKKFFSIYCLYRSINLFLIKLPVLVFHDFFHVKNNASSSNDNDDGELTHDVLAVTLAKIIMQTRTKYSEQVDEDSLVNQLSFIISGCLFLCTLSSVVNTFHSLSKLIPHSLKLLIQGHGHNQHRDNQQQQQASASAASAQQQPKHISLFRSLLISELLGIYTLATVLLLRSNLTDALSSNIDQAIGGEPLQVRFVETWFDRVSLVSCFVTLCGIMLNEIWNHEDEDLNDEFDGFDEEKFIQNEKYA